jgi:hypothetical protein
MHLHYLLCATARICHRPTGRRVQLPGQWWR